MDEQQQYLGTIDYVVFGTMLISCVLIGFYHGFCKKQKNKEDLFMGGGNVGIFPASLSLLAGLISSVLLVGNAAEVYNQGTRILDYFVGVAIFTPIGACIFLPILYNLKFISVHEYLEMRFKSRTVRLTASLLYVCSNIMYMGVAVFAASVSLRTVTGFPVWASVITMTGVTTIYTAIGGLNAVVWTDVLQMIVMCGGMVGGTVVGIMHAGGITEVFDIAEEHGRIRPMDFESSIFHRYSSVAIILGAGFSTSCTYNCFQTQAQRFLSVKDLHSAYLVVAISVVLGMIFMFITYLFGFAIFANYADCDPMLLGHIVRRDEIAAYFVMDHMAFIYGMPGLFVAALYSSNLSTLSSVLNSLAAVTWEDFLKDTNYFSNMSNEGQTRFCKFLAFFYGLIVVLFTFLTGNLGDIIPILASFMGVVTGPMLGIFTLGALFPFVNKYGANVGLIFSSIVMTVISTGARFYPVYTAALPTSIEGCNITMTTPAWFNSTGSDVFTFSTYNETTFSVLNNGTWEPPYPIERPWPEKIYTVSFFFYAALGALMTIGLGIIVSICTGGNYLEEEDSNLVHPLVLKLWRKWQRQFGMYRPVSKKDPQDLKTMEYQVQYTSSM